MQIGDVNRAKLYYLREKVGKKARVRAVQRTDKLDSLCRPMIDDEPEDRDADEAEEPVCRVRRAAPRARAEPVAEASRSRRGR